MQDERTDNFKARVNAGELICNAANSYREEHFPVSEYGFVGSATDKSTGVVTYVTTKVTRGGLFRPSSHEWSIGMQSITLRNLLATASGHQSAHAEDVAHTELSAKLTAGVASILVTLAERDKTKNMILKGIKYLFRPIKDVWKIGKRMTPRERLNKVNEWWLEGRYGWRPFIYDVASQIEAHNKDVGERLTKKTNLPGWENPTEVTVQDIGWYGLKTRLTRRTAFVGWTACGQTGDFRAGTMGNFRKFGWYDLVGAGWDLVPYSFVVDWFCNIGEMARAMQAYLLLDERIGWTRYNWMVAEELKHSVLVPGPLTVGNSVYQIYSVIGEGSPTFHLRQWNRQVRLDFTPYFGTRMDLDWAKVVDLAALLRQAYERCFGEPRRGRHR